MVIPSNGCTQSTRSAAGCLAHAAVAPGSAHATGAAVTAGTASSTGAAVADQRRTIAPGAAVAARITAGPARIAGPASTAVAAIAERADIGEVLADAPPSPPLPAANRVAIPASTTDAAIAHDLAAGAAVTTVGAEPTYRHRRRHRTIRRSRRHRRPCRIRGWSTGPTVTSQEPATTAGRVCFRSGHAVANHATDVAWRLNRLLMSPSTNWPTGLLIQS